MGYKQRFEREIRFNQVLAHDIGNILGSLTLWVGILKRRHPSEPCVEKIETCVDRIGSIIKQLNDSDRIKLGHLKPRKVKFSTDFLENYIKIFTPNAETKGIQLSTCFDGGLVWADKEMVCRVLDNLVSNAIKHTPKNGLVRVVAHSDDRFVVFKVKNTGAPIDSKDFPFLFECYWKKSESGLGLGLFISKSFVELNGGTLSVSSDPSETVFTFTVPRSPLASSVQV